MKEDIWNYVANNTVWNDLICGGHLKGVSLCWCSPSRITDGISCLDNGFKHQKSVWFTGSRPLKTVEELRIPSETAASEITNWQHLRTEPRQKPHRILVTDTSAVQRPHESGLSGQTALEKQWLRNHSEQKRFVLDLCPHRNMPLRFGFSCSRLSEQFDQGMES